MKTVLNIDNLDRTERKLVEDILNGESFHPHKTYTLQGYHLKYIVQMLQLSHGYQELCDKAIEKIGDLYD